MNPTPIVDRRLSFPEIQANVRRAAWALSALALLASGLAGTAAFAKEEPLPAALPPFGADKPLPVPQIQESKLANGLTVWVLPRTGLPLVSATLVVRGGTASDPAGTEGTAALLADALREGTRSRSAQQIAEQLQAVGGSLDTNASDDAIFVRVDGLKTGTAKMLEILGDVSLQPSFPGGEVDLVKANALQSLQAAKANPEFDVQRIFSEAVFGDHPYRITNPTEAAIEGVTPVFLAAQHAARFRPERALLLVMGAVDGKQVAAEVKRRFGSWKGSGEAAPLAAALGAEYGRKTILVDRPGSIQSNVRVGRPGPRIQDPEYYPLLVANTIYGGSFGSRLTQNIREDKGYTYSPGSSVQTFAEGGLFSTRAAVRTEVTGASLMEIFYELDRVGQTLPTDAEISRAKRYQIGLYLLRNQISGALETTLLGNWVKGLPPQAIGEVVPKVEAITAADVQRAGRAWMRSRDQVVVVGGDVAKIRAEVELLGPVEVATP